VAASLLSPLPLLEQSRARRLAGPLATLTGLAVVTTAIGLRDPHVRGSWGICPSAALGFDCPGCGCMRAVYDVTHLRLADAASSNVFFVVALPVVLFLLARWVLDRWRGTERGGSAATTPLLVLAGVGLVTFTVLRNLPMFGWLAA
jgi:hypothetical protein